MKKRLRKCNFCRALYNPDRVWYFGILSEDTTTDFDVLGKREPGECPVCGKRVVS